MLPIEESSEEPRVKLVAQGHSGLSDISSPLIEIVRCFSSRTDITFRHLRCLSHHKIKVNVNFAPWRAMLWKSIYEKYNCFVVNYTWKKCMYDNEMFISFRLFPLAFLLINMAFSLICQCHDLLYQEKHLLRPNTPTFLLNSMWKAGGCSTFWLHSYLICLQTYTGHSFFNCCEVHQM